MSVAYATKPTKCYVPIQQLLEELEHNFDLSPVNGKSVIRCFCPIHKDRTFRSFIIDIDLSEYKCAFIQCPGFKGGTLLDLFAKVYQCTLEEATEYWEKKINGSPVSRAEIIHDLDSEPEIERVKGVSDGLPQEIMKTKSEKTFNTDSRTPIKDEFMELMTKEINRSRRYKYPVSLLVLEIHSNNQLTTPKDISKSNATQSELVDFLSTKIRDSDIIYSYGFNKIAMLLCHMSKPQAEIAAKRFQNLINKKVGNYSTLNGVPFTNCGLSTLGSEDKNISSEEFLEQAISKLWEKTQKE